MFYLTRVLGHWTLIESRGKKADYLLPKVDRQTRALNSESFLLSFWNTKNNQEPLKTLLLPFVIIAMLLAKE